MIIKKQIAKYLLIIGFILNMVNYGISLFEMYRFDSETVSAILDTTDENSESKETEGTEKEDNKEKNKIVQSYVGKTIAMDVINKKTYPEFYLNNPSVYLEYTTPPPEYS